MQATAAPPEEKVVLYDVSWETYERLLAEHPNSTGTRFFYDEGMLEIMVVGLGHENPNRVLARLAEIVAEETGRDILEAGSTTFRWKDLKKGFEPDSSFYIEHAALIRGKDDVEMGVDPPPDLTIEVDITRSSLHRMAIFAAIGVSELWRYDGERVSIHRLEGGTYREVEASIAMPRMTAAQATLFLQASQRESAPVWLRRVRDWVRAAAR